MQVDTINSYAGAIYPELIEIRRDIHRHPEISGKEQRTANLVAQYLRELGLEVKTGVGGDGVVAFLHGARYHPVVAYRADMDAIEIDLFEDHEFSSEIPNVGHGCGHDIHTVIALGAAHILAKIKSELPGSVKFIFQPSEENLSGAAKMLADGVLNENPPQAIFACHIGPFECGRVMAIPGLGLPGIEEFEIYFQGERALEIAKIVEETVNRVGTIHYPRNDQEMRQFFENLVEHANLPEPFTFVEGYLDEDSVVDKAKIRGFIKASGQSEYTLARDEINRFTGEHQDASLVVFKTFEKTLPDMINDEILVMWAINPLQEVVGCGNVIVSQRTTPYSGEDFALFLQRIPGAMFFLGASNQAKGIFAIPHSRHFAADEEVILVGMKSMANLLYRYLAGY